MFKFLKYTFYSQPFGFLPFLCLSHPVLPRQVNSRRLNCLLVSEIRVLSSLNVVWVMEVESSAAFSSQLLSSSHMLILMAIQLLMVIPLLGHEDLVMVTLVSFCRMSWENWM